MNDASIVGDSIGDSGFFLLQCAVGRSVIGGWWLVVGNSFGLPAAHPQVLGVLYNVSSDYASAAEQFEAALKERPTDYSLLNKVGSLSILLSLDQHRERLIKWKIKRR